ncbi:MAG: PQQ-dependent sugar dehydrogenase [Rhodobiaceae bacterium]|nr:PQQ-dependent sugar dehydrogenase [Rhodobiaceae bacterium]
MSGTIFLEASELSVLETEGTVIVPILRTGDLSLPVNIIYGVTPDNATQGVDYVDTDGTVRMEAGQDRVYVPVTILDDGLSEPTESFVVSIINVDSGMLLFPRTARVSILDNENPVTDPVDPPLVSDYDVADTVIASGLVQPIALEFAPHDPSLIYIAEKRGIIKVFDLDTGTVTGTFLDISAQVNNIADRGLMDIALHPDFANNPYVYAFYVVDPADSATQGGNAGLDGGGNRFAYLMRYTADAADNYESVVPGSGVVLLGGAGQTLADISGGGAIDSTNPGNVNVRASDIDAATGQYIRDYIAVDSKSHAGGSIAFGPDGALYVSTGDGASYNFADPRAVAVQSLDSLRGKILRIDPLSGDGLADNPFAAAGSDLTDNAAKVWQLGLRNPFSMGFDLNGNLFITETGWNTYEEINSAGAGANFGWPYYEGGDNGTLVQTNGYNTLPGASAFYQQVASGAITVTPAFRAFAHASSAPGYQVQAITGADTVLNSPLYPDALRNHYIFTDVSQGEVFAVDVNDRQDVKFLFKTASGLAPVYFRQGPDGYMYYANIVTGQVGRLMITDPDAPPTDAPSAGILTADYFSASGATALAGVDFGATPAFSEEVTQVQQAAGTGSFYAGGPVDNFAARYTGTFSISTAGGHSFHLTSDDGSALFIDGQRVIDNDGLHSDRELSATVTLGAGSHTIELRYFEATGSATLDLDWSGPGFARQPMRFLGNPDGDLIAAVAAENMTVTDIGGDRQTWQEVSDIDAIGGAALKALGQAGEEARVEVSFAKAETYTVYARVRGFDGGSDSIYGQSALDGAANRAVHFAGDGNFRWVELGAYTVSAGGLLTPRTIAVGIRELNAELDAVIVHARSGLTQGELDALARGQATSPGVGLVAVMSGEDLAVSDIGGNGLTWQPVATGGAFGGAVLKALGEAGETARATVSFAEVGEYTLYARVRGFDGASDSIFVQSQLDGATDQAIHFTGDGAFHWLKVALFPVAAGETGTAHEIVVGLRELNAELDELVLHARGNLQASELDAIVLADTPGVGDGLVAVVAAEDMIADDANGDGFTWQAVQAAGAIGGGALKANGQAGEEARADITFDEAGTYTLYARVRGFDGASDSLYVQSALNGVADQATHFAGTGEFIWIAAGSYTADAGIIGVPQRLSIAIREANAEVDELVVHARSDMTGAELDALAIAAHAGHGGGSGRVPTVNLSQATLPVTINLYDVNAAPTAEGLFLNAVGGPGDDTLIGNAMGNILDGLAGADIMVGSFGDDIFVVDNSGDIVADEPDGGIEQVNSSVSFTLFSHLENLTLLGSDDIDAIGNELDNILIGNAGNNTLDGLAGADTMVGNAGDDIFVVDNVGDTVSDLASGGGTDQVNSWVSFALVDHIENLSLLGTSDINAIGNALANVLIGNSGNNTLDGLGGADTMVGNGGDDIYVVDNAGDIVSESPGGGTDQVNSSVSFVLFANIENLSLLGSGNINATGNELANTLIGNSGSNVFLGNAGNDLMIGNGGNDTFVFGDGCNDDTITDFSGGAGLGDQLNVAAFGFADFNAVLAAATDISGAVVIQLDADDSITLQGVAKADLAGDDFVLV